MSSPSTATPSTSSSVPAPLAQAQAKAPLPPNALNVYAQRLNNSAALCIEIGQYDRAIGSLQRALKLSEKHMNYKMSEAGAEQTKSTHSQQPSQEYTLDGCIAFSDANSLFSGKNKAAIAITEERSTTTRTTTTATERNNRVCHGNKRRRVDRSISSSEPNSTKKFESNSNENNNSSNTNNDAATAPVVSTNTTSNDTDYYVYGRPIRVPRQSDDMGSILFLIILFNLALAHHLKASTMTNPISDASVQSKVKTIGKALMLYQLVFQYWSKLQHKQDLINSNGSSDSKPNNGIARKNNNYSSIRFLMILQNNLGQMYQWTNNPTKEKECLRDLLSTVLVVTDQTNQHGRNSSSHRHQANSSSCSFQRDLEGFLENTGGLTVDERCAEAA